jgi:hypothetical protein
MPVGAKYLPRINQGYGELDTQMLRPYPRGYGQCPTVVHSDLVSFFGKAEEWWKNCGKPLNESARLIQL